MGDENAPLQRQDLHAGLHQAYYSKNKDIHNNHTFTCSIHNQSVKRCISIIMVVIIVVTYRCFCRYIVLIMLEF